MFCVAVFAIVVIAAVSISVGVAGIGAIECLVLNRKCQFGKCLFYATLNPRLPPWGYYCVHLMRSTDKPTGNRHRNRNAIAIAIVSNSIATLLSRLSSKKSTIFSFSGRFHASSWPSPTIKGLAPFADSHKFPANRESASI